ncbi:LytR/AlgR family response regulator transcription factor [Penaeicola halotolerans]|uniref:LytR/AlgR family response regulator transcription factor n=1 Tax=Penaeicola halotolerans TaxID=2793196 RepID=UPI001CF92DA5|nr:response regulator [Penaeicola halotolerans]
MRDEKILIVEDEVFISENLQEILELIGFTNIEIANSANQTVKAIKKTRPDVVFMDIKLKGDKDGIELGEIVKKMVDVPIIYVTSYSDPEILERAKRINPAGFIVKPFNSNDIHAMVEIVLFNAKNRPSSVDAPMPGATDPAFLVNEAVFIKNDTNFEKVRHKDILYIEANGNMVTVKSRNKDFVLRKSMKEMEDKLPSQQFLRIQKSYIVQLDAIELLNTKEVTLDNGMKVPVGRQYYNALLAKLNTITES